MNTGHYNAIVVGLGAMGSATLYHLARRGWRVLGLEQFAPGNKRGSSHGDSRIIRETYFEHPLYVPLVRRAHELWRELEDRGGSSLMTITGGIMIGPPDGSVVRGTLRSVEEHGLPHEILTPAEVRERFPAFHLDKGLVAVFDPRAGFLDPEACNRAHVKLAREAGADARFVEIKCRESLAHLGWSENLVWQLVLLCAAQSPGNDRAVGWAYHDPAGDGHQR